MNQYSSKTQRGTVIDLPSGVLWILWQCVRLPLLLLLTILEPVVSFVLGVPHFPFVLMLGMSLGVGGMLIPHQYRPSFRNAGGTRA